MSVPLHLQPIVEAIEAELQRQTEDAHGVIFTGPADDGRTIIDGPVDLVALARAVMFCPTGDNHHNAAACPHCTPRIPLAPPPRAGGGPPPARPC